MISDILYEADPTSTVFEATSKLFSKFGKYFVVDLVGWPQLRKSTTNKSWYSNTESDCSCGGCRFDTH